jgi:hypothetical protein
VLRLPSTTAFALALALAAFAAASPARAQPVAEPELKAAYLYNFAQLTEYPAAAGSAPRFVLCTIGRNSLGSHLARLEERSILGRPISVRPLTAASQARECHLLYIAPGESARVAALVDALASFPVLTVADAETSGPTAAVITLVPRGERVGFAVNLASAKRAGLRLSSRLLKLASEIQGEP